MQNYGFIKEYLLEFLRNTNALADRQFDILPGRSTVLQLLHVLDKWTEALDNVTHVNTLYSDFMTAFEQYQIKDYKST